MGKIDKTINKLINDFRKNLSKLGKSSVKVDESTDGELTLTAQTKKELKDTIRKAQRRIRNAPEFSKNLAKSRGIKLTTKTDDKSLVRNASLANYINDNEIFSKRGYNSFIKDMSNELRLPKKETDYIFSQIDVETMDFISSSPLRYGSNPQLDFVFNEAIELANSFKTTAENLQRFEFDIDDFYNELF